MDNIRYHVHRNNATRMWYFTLIGLEAGKAPVTLYTSPEIYEVKRHAERSAATARSSLRSQLASLNPLITNA